MKTQSNRTFEEVKKENDIVNSITDKIIDAVVYNDDFRMLHKMSFDNLFENTTISFLLTNIAIAQNKGAEYFIVTNKSIEFYSIISKQEQLQLKKEKFLDIIKDIDNDIQSIQNTDQDKYPLVLQALNGITKNKVYNEWLCGLYHKKDTDPDPQHTIHSPQPPAPKPTILSFLKSLKCLTSLFPTRKS